MLSLYARSKIFEAIRTIVHLFSLLDNLNDRVSDLGS
jgi:hypothetical protein